MLLIFFPWQYVVIPFLIMYVAWAFFRYKGIDLVTAYILHCLMFLRWPVTLISGMALALRQKRYPIALIALFWPLVSTVLGILTPTDTEMIHNEMMSQLGCPQTPPAETLF